MTSLVISPSVEDGAAGYTLGSQIVHAWNQGRLTRMWALGSRIVSGQLRKAHGGGTWKTLDRMPTLTTEMLDKLESIGVEHPSTYSDCYHQLAYAPYLKRTYNGLFDWWRGGPWEEALQRGTHDGEWWRYDLRSAYRWAATLGLPDVNTFQVRTHRHPENVNGLWVGYIEQRDDLPNTFRRATGPVVISSEEIRGYGVMVDVIRGVTWETTLPNDYVDRTLDKLPCSKEAGRAYWGRWVARDPLRTYTAKSSWDLPNRTANFIWGWLIVGRVRLKVWQAAKQAAHVYVDEVLVPHELPTGPLPGHWHLKQHYTKGVHIKRTGWYGPLGDRPAMQTGVATTMLQ